MSFSSRLCLFLFLFCFYAKPSISDPRATEAALICSKRAAPVAERQIFISNFLAALDGMTPSVTSRGYSSAFNGTGKTAVFALGECMKDLSQSDCSLCFAQCKTQVLRCLPFQFGINGGRLFYDGCFIRYDDYMFFKESLSKEDKVVCGNATFSGDKSAFEANALSLVRKLSDQAPNNDGFSVGSVSHGNVSVYGLAQCWDSVTGNACKRCLEGAVSEIKSCPPKQEGRALNAGCYLRYSPQKFYNNSTNEARAGKGGNNRLAVVLAAVSSALAVVLIFGAAVFFVKKRILKKRNEKKQLGNLLATVNKSKLNFSYETLEKATDYFHSSNKLGQGGSGSVYKGILPDGDIVAIKRLFFNTRQWADHFFNEVNLISGIQHKNLVKLLGCSITGKNISQPLRWEARCNIILGTAEGLAYLHEESNLRIIHRDIKLSNVLLDEDLNAKIADFGLARLFPDDKTHISTAVAGTLGYMAPEYVVCGRLTEKADVYSFGILVIELICGQRNNSFSLDSYSVLQMVWNHYGSGTLYEAVDPALEGHFQNEEASRLLQIGLICAQASADLRPSMSVVVRMLTNSHDIPQPAQPPFLNPTSVDNMRRENENSRGGSSGNSSAQVSWIEPR